MGMASSQARLLSLTVRLHDVELKAQNIESQKIDLATKEDAVYKRYMDALDATKINVAFYTNGIDKTYMEANYNSLCTFNEARCKQYSLIDNSSGLVLVNQDIKDAYDKFGKDKYAFALTLMGADISDLEQLSSIETDACKCATTGENANTTLKQKYNAMLAAEGEDKSSAQDAYRENLYKCSAQEIYDACCCNQSDDSDFNVNELNFYINLWNAIVSAGGCQVIDREFETGDDGTNWLNNVVHAGIVTIQEFNASGHKGEWTDTSPATSINKNNLQELKDETDVKKAEAKYEHDLKIINRKDTQFDKELSTLETERTSMKSEIESIKKVKDDNIERTFGIFS